MTDSIMQTTKHEGRNVKRIREILGVKQETLATTLGINQQKMSFIESKEKIEDEQMEEIARALNVPVEAIKSFDEEKAVNIIANTITNYDNAAVYNYNPTFNPIDKIVELYDSKIQLYVELLKSEREKVELLEKILKEKNKN